MDIIQLLPDSVANQIAAGEVIQRPASVIKELVENAIDAGATTISVLVVDAGKASIQVIDNGKGMSDTDARLSFERHATSKIRQADDLFTLTTMGFRGEALASIAAVAQVTLQTRRSEDEVGTRLIIAGSQVKEQMPVTCPVGANFMVDNLFYNVPARRKFLKSNATEMSNIMQAFERMVLVYPDITFSIYSNGMELKQLQAGTLHQRITDVFGKKMNKELLPMSLDTSLCTINGFVGKPESARKKGSPQFFFVNGRYMKHPYFHKAVMTAYDRLLPEGTQIAYFIYLTVDPHDIDVNIHPVKTEIKFDNEREIWQMIMALVRNTLGTFTDAGSLDFDTEGKPHIPVFNANGEGGATAPETLFDPTYNPFHVTPTAPPTVDDDNPFLSATDDTPPLSQSKASHTPPSMPRERSAKGWDELFGSTTTPHTRSQQSTDNSQPLFHTPHTTVGDSPTATAASADLFADRSTDHLQVRGMYILTEVRGGLLVIDQNRASQRILYDEYMRSIEQHTPNTQRVLFPDVVQFPPSTVADIQPILSDLSAMGFDLTDLGGGSYSIQGVPAGLGGMNAVGLVGDLVATAMDSGISASGRLHSLLAEELAAKAATPYGEVLTNDDMETLIRQLLACDTPRYTAKGQLVAHLIDISKVNKLFT